MVINNQKSHHLAVPRVTSRPRAQIMAQAHTVRLSPPSPPRMFEHAVMLRCSGIPAVHAYLLEGLAAPTATVRTTAPEEAPPSMHDSNPDLLEKIEAQSFEMRLPACMHPPTRFSFVTRAKGCGASKWRCWKVAVCTVARYRQATTVHVSLGLQCLTNPPNRSRVSRPGISQRIRDISLLSISTA